MDLIEKRIKVKSADEITLIPIGDIHVGNVCFDKEYFENMIEWILSQKDTYTIGMGDYCDSIIHLDANRYDVDCVDVRFNTPEKQYSYIRKWFGKLADAGKLLAIIEGNHEYCIKHRYGHEHCNRLAHELGVKNLGVQGMIRLVLEESYKTKQNKSSSYDIFAHHGHGGGRRTGSVVNKIEDFAQAYDAEIFMMGHSHKKSCNIQGRWKMNRVRNGDGMLVLTEKKIAFVNTGTFMDSFVVGGSSTYAERKGYNPTVKGVVKIILNNKGDIHFRE